jgi:hypothetical protein
MCSLCDDFRVICRNRNCKQPGTRCNCGKRFRPKDCPLCSDDDEDLETPDPIREPLMTQSVQSPMTAAFRAVFVFGFMLFGYWCVYQVALQNDALTYDTTIAIPAQSGR